MAQPGPQAPAPLPQPNFANLANSLQGVANEVLLLPNVPAVQNAQVLNAILLQLQQQSQQLQQQSQQLQQLQQLPQQVQAIANEIHQERARAPIRRYNSRALLCADSIRLFPFVGAAPQAQPRTVEALLALTGPEIDALFIAFGDPVPQGLVAVRRRALAENLGILFDMA